MTIKAPIKILNKKAIGILFACFLFAFTSAKAKPADNYSINGQHEISSGDEVYNGSQVERKNIEFIRDRREKEGGSSNTSLPINNQVWFLLIAGAAIGCKVIIKKSNQGINQFSN